MKLVEHKPKATSSNSISSLLSPLAGWFVFFWTAVVFRVQGALVGPSILMLTDANNSLHQPSPPPTPVSRPCPQRHPGLSPFTNRPPKGDKREGCPIEILILICSPWVPSSFLQHNVIFTSGLGQNDYGWPRNIFQSLFVFEHFQKTNVGSHRRFPFPTSFTFQVHFGSQIWRSIP